MNYDPAGLLSLLEWEYQPDHGPKRWRGYLKGNPKMTLFLLNICEDRDDRCNLLGAVIPDDEDGKGLNYRCLIQWGKFSAEKYLRDFQETVQAMEAAAPWSALPAAALDLGRLINSLPPDVNKKLSLHDLKRICDNYNSVPCPNCYGGHFRPCQWCGDTGLVTYQPQLETDSPLP